MSGFENKFGSYSQMQLNELLEDDEKLDKIVQEMEEVQELQQIKHLTLAGNRSLAEQNLLLQPRLDHQKNELTKRHRCLQDLFEAYQLHKSTLDHSSGNSSLDTLLALLQAEGAKIEEETEKIADSFLEGNVPLDTFVDDYLSKRKLAHLRRVKIDKLRETVLKDHRIPQASVPLAQPLEIPAMPAQTASTAVAQPTLLPYPPIPPRGGPQFPDHIPSYPPHPSVSFLSQYPPTLPQRPPPGLAPQPGFIVQ